MVRQKIPTEALGAPDLKVMLAATIDSLTQLSGRYPLLGSPKLDGVRAVVVDGKLYSRNMKPIPNKFVQSALPLRAMNGWDGELIVGKAGAANAFNTTQSGVMSVDGEPDFTFYVFDYVPRHGDMQFMHRFMGLKDNVKLLGHKRVKLVPQTTLADEFAVHQYEKLMLERGYEGVMLRTKHGIYKKGRSTMKEGHLMKLKQFLDSEAIVLGMVEQMENTNEAKRDELGRSKRSSHKSGKRPKGTLGAIQVRDVVTGVEFEIGTGFDDISRSKLWAAREDSRTTIIGKTVKYKYQPAGVKEKPRFPVYIGLRLD